MEPHRPADPERRGDVRRRVPGIVSIATRVEERLQKPRAMGQPLAVTGSPQVGRVVRADPLQAHARRAGLCGYQSFGAAPPFRGWLAYVAEVKEKREKERRVRHVLARFRNQKFAQSEPPPRTSS